MVSETNKCYTATSLWKEILKAGEGTHKVFIKKRNDYCIEYGEIVERWSKMETAKYYQEEVVKLLAILNQDDHEGDAFIGREYMREKINRILSGQGIGIHPTLKSYVEEKLKQLRWEKWV